MKNFRLHTLMRIMRSAAGLFIYAIGVYLTIQAGIGLAPWESLSMGASYHLPFSYGITHTLIAVVILVIDLLMKEKIGYGTLLDAFLVGLYVDFVRWTDLIPPAGTFIISVLMMAAGLFIIAFGQYFYISAGVGCGPRDTLMIALGKRMKSVPIGAVQSGLYVIVLVIAFLLGGPIGAGTFLAVFGSGFAMQLVFRAAHFEPRDITHENVLETTSALISGADTVS